MPLIWTLEFGPFAARLEGEALWQFSSIATAYCRRHTGEMSTETKAGKIFADAVAKQGSENDLALPGDDTHKQSGLTEIAPNVHVRLSRTPWI